MADDEVRAPAAEPAQEAAPAALVAPTKAVHPLFKSADQPAPTSSSIDPAASTSALVSTAPPTAANNSRNMTAAAPRKNVKAAPKVGNNQGRLAFGAPGEGWRIEKAPPTPASCSDAEDVAGIPTSEAATGVADAPKLNSSTKKKGAAPAAKAPRKGASKGKDKDPEAEEMKGLKGKGKTPTQPKKLKKGGSKIAKDALDANEEAGDGLPEMDAPAVVIQSSAGGTAGDEDNFMIAGPSKPRKKPTVTVKPSMSTKDTSKASTQGKRKTVTVLSSGSETETGSVKSKMSASVHSIVIDDDSDVENGAPSSTLLKAHVPAKAVHPFFGGPALKRPKLTKDLGSSAELAIDVEADPIPATKPYTSYFSSRTASKPKVQATVAVEARWPTREETVQVLHSDAPTHSNCLAHLSDIQRSKMRESTSADASAFWSRLLPKLPTSPTVSSASFSPPHLGSPSTEALSDRFARHPAFTRLANTAPAHTPDLWTDRFRPLAAAEVLGNETEAVYLRDWLVALQLKVAASDVKERKKAGTKRQVVRKVDKGARKRAKKANADDWIVDDDKALEYYDDPIQEANSGSDDGGVSNLKRAPAASVNPPPPLSPVKLAHRYTTSMRPHESGATAGAASSAYPPLASSSLSNSILLVGPSGSGKTAAVYACAHELGWDVFEVYPGVRRSGQALVEMVGEVGKNHMVGRGGTGGGGAAASFSRPSLSAGALGSFLKKGDGFGFLKDKHEPIAHAAEPVASASSGGRQSDELVRQSCILLEEVDVLFPEDKGFWPAVVSLISESRRPVIMTCNDISTVPINDLPLQTSLVFLPPTTEVVTPYLQLLSRAGGLDVDSSSISSFHRDGAYHPFAAGQAHVVGHPAPSQPPDTVDLRRTIHNLQSARGLYLSNRRFPAVEEEDSEAQFDAWEGQTADWTSLPYKASLTQAMAVDPPPSAPEGSASELQQLHAIVSHLDSVSFANAHVDWRASDLAEIFDSDHFATSDNDPVDYTYLHKPLPKLLSADLPEYGFNRRIAREILSVSRSVYDKAAAQTAISVGASSVDIQKLLPHRRSHLSLLLDMLEPLIEPPAPLLPSPALILDYVPYIQVMVHIDDVLEAEDKSQAAAGFGRGKQGRVMRASAQAGMAALAQWTGGVGGRVAYQRQLYELEGPALQAARDTRLEI